MTITVLLFASYAEAVGKSSIDIELDAGATVNDVVNRVRALGRASSLPAAPMVAVNERYASRDCAVHHGDEVALIPPVAGG